MSLTCTYICTCYPDFLQDHHNREHEILISAWAGSTSKKSIEEQLIDSALSQWDSSFPKYLDWQVKRVIRAEFSQYKAKDINFTDCDPEENESCIYAYLSWESNY